MPTNIRAARPSDWPRLSYLERTYFSELRDGGRWFNDAFLQPTTVGGLGGRRSFVSVAELRGVVEGFALAFAYSFPGTGDLDPQNMLLQYLAVSDEHRRAGIGRELLEHVEERLAPHRQNVMIAHVPAGEAEFYRRTGWTVAGREYGFAWIAFNNFMRADAPVRGSDYEHIAAKILRPAAIRTSFEFPSLTSAPISDAVTALEQLLDRGALDIHDLDEGTRQMLSFVRSRSRP